MHCEGRSKNWSRQNTAPSPQPVFICIEASPARPDRFTPSFRNVASNRHDAFPRGGARISGGWHSVWLSAGQNEDGRRRSRERQREHRCHQCPSDHGKAHRCNHLAAGYRKRILRGLAGGKALARFALVHERGRSSRVGRSCVSNIPEVSRRQSRREFHRSIPVLDAHSTRGRANSLRNCGGGQQAYFTRLDCGCRNSTAGGLADITATCTCTAGVAPTTRLTSLTPQAPLPPNPPR